MSTPLSNQDTISRLPAKSGRSVAGPQAKILRFGWKRKNSSSSRVARRVGYQRARQREIAAEHHISRSSDSWAHPGIYPPEAQTALRKQNARASIGNPIWSKPKSR